MSVSHTHANIDDSYSVCRCCYSRCCCNCGGLGPRQSYPLREGKRVNRRQLRSGQTGPRAELHSASSRRLRAKHPVARVVEVVVVEVAEVVGGAGGVGVVGVVGGAAVVVAGITFEVILGVVGE